MSVSYALHEENKRGEMIGYLSAKEASKIRNRRDMTDKNGKCKLENTSRVSFL